MSINGIDQFTEAQAGSAGATNDSQIYNQLAGDAVTLSTNINDMSAQDKANLGIAEGQFSSSATYAWDVDPDNTNARNARVFDGGVQFNHDGQGWVAQNQPPPQSTVKPEGSMGAVQYSGGVTVPDTVDTAVANQTTMQSSSAPELLNPAISKFPGLQGESNYEACTQANGEQIASYITSGDSEGLTAFINQNVTDNPSYGTFEAGARRAYSILSSSGQMQTEADNRNFFDSVINPARTAIGRDAIGEDEINDIMGGASGDGSALRDGTNTFMVNGKYENTNETGRLTDLKIMLSLQNSSGANPDVIYPGQSSEEIDTQVDNTASLITSMTESNNTSAIEHYAEENISEDNPSSFGIYASGASEAHVSLVE